jgi:hypothetical protein
MVMVLSLLVRFGLSQPLMVSFDAPASLCVSSVSLAIMAAVGTISGVFWFPGRGFELVSTGGTWPPTAITAYAPAEDLIKSEKVIPFLGLGED